MSLDFKVLSKFPLSVELPGHPPNVNNMYFRGRRRVFKKSKVVKWESLAGIMVRTAAKNLYGTHDLSLFAHYPLELEFAFYRASWKGKSKDTNKRYLRLDVDNFLKAGVDILCKTLGLEDAAVVSLKAVKVDDPNGIERTQVRMSFLG